ncbi:MAG: phage portal protein [Cyanobacteriota bacterium]
MPPVRRVTSRPSTLNAISPIKSYGVARDLRDFLKETFRHQTNRLSPADLRRISKAIVVQRAIRRIGNGVLSMPWSVLPPEDLIRDVDALNLAKRLRSALKKPNRGEHNLYSLFIRAIVQDSIVLGVSGIERHLGDLSDPADQPFWLFLVDPAHLSINKNWSPEIAGIEPRFYDHGDRLTGGKPIFAQDLFLIQTNASTHELVPPSPLEIAYHMIQAWLGLSDFQNTTTSQAVREYILVLKGADQNDVDAFRAYWESEVEGSGKIPIVGGEGIQVEKLGARNDDELYLRYTDYILRIIAVAFDLSSRDYGITEHDNRATAGVSADTVFQDAVLPIALCIKEHLEMEVIDYYFPGFRLEITDTEPRSQEQEANTATNLFKERIISRNEARIRSGHEALPGGDVFVDGSTVLTENDVREAKESQPPQKRQAVAARSKTHDRGAIAQQLWLF